MTKNLKFFSIAFVISLSFFFGVDALEGNLKDFFFWQELAENPHVLTAQANQQILEQKLREIKPIRNWQSADLEIEAESAISVLIDNQGSRRILFKKDSEKKLPIASLTKLMSAHLILENYDLNQVIEISEQAAGQPEAEENKFKAGEKFQVKDLLYPMLIESSNAATFALTEVIGGKAFSELMNLEAQNIGLNNTYFINSTGLDVSYDDFNFSTCQDLAELTDYLLVREPLIWKILATPELYLYSQDGAFHHQLINTNELLGKIPSIVGGKTGETPKSGKCLLLVVQAPKSQGFLVNVILNSQDRFGEMEKLIAWLKSAYKW